MKLKWSIIKEQALAAFRMFKRSKRGSFIYGVNPFYDRLRGVTIARVPESGEKTRAFNALKANWDADAREFAEPKLRISFRGLSEADREEKGLPKDYFWNVSPAYGFGRSLEIEGISKGEKQIWFGKDVPEGGIIHAVQVTLDEKAKARSRLNLVVCPECVGQPLQRKLYALTLALRHPDSSSSGAVCQWKVMSPELGAKGPESAVIYLTEPLADAKVQLVINVLSAVLHSDLVALQPCPFSMIKIKDGIYGIDLPDENTEKKAFNDNKSDSSAVRLMSMIICKAGWQAAENLYHAKTLKAETVEDEEKHLRTCLDSVLKELGWELVD